MADEVPYAEAEQAMQRGGTDAGLQLLAAHFRNHGRHHELFRMQLLCKRHELGLPLLNPGELPGVPEQPRKAYEDFVESACRAAGELYLLDGNIIQAWRYLKTIGERAAVRRAIERLAPAQAGDDVLALAIQEGLHPVRGFELLLGKHDLCTAIRAFARELYAPLDERKKIAGLLVKRLYRDLVVNVRRDIRERGKPAPEETDDLVEIVRSRPWLFENGNTHADPAHIAAVLRIGTLCGGQDEWLMALSVAEYGRKVPAVFEHGADAPFEGGCADYAKFFRALLGQNAEQAAEFFCARVGGYDHDEVGNEPAEIAVSLLWRIGRKDEALGLWENFVKDMPPDLESRILPSFYELCQQAGGCERMARVAQASGDSAAWSAAMLLKHGAAAAKAQTTAASGGGAIACPPKEEPADTASGDLS